MAVEVTQFGGITQPGWSTIHAPQTPSYGTELVANGAESGDFDVGTRFVRVKAVTDSRVSIGLVPIATGGWHMQAGQTEYFGVSAGHKLACAAG